MTITTTIVRERRKSSKYETFKTNFPKSLVDADKLEGGDKLEWERFGKDYILKVIKKVKS